MGMGLAMLILWIVIILIAVFIVWTLISRAGSGSVSAQESALDILKKRYVRGEISEEEFEHMRKELEK